MNEPVWFRQNRDASDRFAALLEQQPEEASDAGTSAGGRPPEPPDGFAEGFAEDLAIVGMLNDLGSEPVLADSARSRMRAALLAEAESTPLALAERDTAPVQARKVTPINRKARRKASLWAAATAAGVVAFGAFGIELAQTALPGDLLYDVKRTTESISLDLTFSEDGKAFKQLEMAETRIAELTALTERDAADGGASVDDLAAYRSVITDLNTTVAAASRGVTGYVPQTDGADLRTLREWAGEQVELLNGLRPAIPEGAVGELDGSVELLGQVKQRAMALLDRWQCDQITSGRADRLGALPAQASCATAAGVPDAVVEPRANERQKKPAAERTGEQGNRTPSTKPGAGGGTGGEQPGEQGSNPGGTGGTGGQGDTDPPVLQLPELPGDEPEDDGDGEPNVNQPTGLPLLPLLTELPKIDLGLG